MDKYYSSNRVTNIWWNRSDFLDSNAPICHWQASMHSYIVLILGYTHEQKSNEETINLRYEASFLIPYFPQQASKTYLNHSQHWWATVLNIEIVQLIIMIIYTIDSIQAIAKVCSLNTARSGIKISDKNFSWTFWWSCVHYGKRGIWQIFCFLVGRLCGHTSNKKVIFWLKQ